MKTYIVIETADVEITGIQVFSSLCDAEKHFVSLMEENQVQEISTEDLTREVEGTLRLCGDDSYSAQLIEREVK